MGAYRRNIRSICLGGTALVSALALMASPASAQQQRFELDVPSQPLDAALRTFAQQSRQQLIFAIADTKGFNAPALNGSYSPDEAIQTLLAGTDLHVHRTPAGVFMITANTDPQGGSAAGGGADVDALIVTAQKREEDIQDVPIAISAFSQEDLTRSQVAGGPDLITQVPNMTFTKTNFSSYSVQIRGIGTQAISATTDPAVAVAFNNTPFIRNRFFEQEFYDLQRVEVLRGPQGTLYGRNATAGVVNIISAKPKFSFEAKASADISNYNTTRVEGMVNVPLVEDMVALRIAGAWTKRDGYAFNAITNAPIDGRDLWSTRVSLRITPNDRIDANLIWEHFEENDDRLRSGKQLCKKDVVTEVAGFPVGYFDALENTGFLSLWSGVQATFSQGCTRSSFYSPDSFQTPNGIMLPYYLPLGAIGLPVVHDADPDLGGDQPLDPYLSTTQSQDLRVIESAINPDYRAKNDLGELQIEVDLGGGLTLSSETSYANDTVYSFQDFNRFNTAPGAWVQPDQYGDSWIRPGVLQEGPNGGIFCDPQLGCSDRLVAVDISTAKASQFGQEFRLSSDFDGPFNFSLGGNFLRADSEDKYYVFINSLSMISARSSELSTFGFDVNSLPPYSPGVTDNGDCLLNGYAMGDPSRFYPVTACDYIDPNPIGSLNDQGHNYFLSKNPYKLISYAAFGEAYYNISPSLKITAGLRWTVDKKDAPRIPTWLLASNSVGYPVAETIEQEWREPTGRIAIDWKPDLAFTDETLLYASFAHGYKAGGANPPGFVRIFYSDSTVAQINAANSATRPLTFDAEFVDAFELGSKNTLADGRVTLNLAAFYYDYKDYQISEIVDRSAFNRNFDAEVWGAELESDWRPVENLRLGLKIGYQKTRIADGEQAIDLMDRTAGDPRWTLSRPFPTFASSCILPSWLFVGNVASRPANPELVGLGGVGGGNPGGCELAYQLGVDPVTQTAYQDPAFGPDYMHSGVINYTAFSTDPADYPGLNWAGGVVTDRTYPGWDPSTAPNNGEGIFKPLGGNELPNAPHWTATVTGDYTLPLPNDWLVSLHTDLHWQSQSWWRVFNDHEYGKLHPYFTMNLAAIFTNEEAGWNIMAYVKNVTDETAITGAFLLSDDTALVTNVFLTEPRLYGLRVTKAWKGGPLLGSFGERRDGPYPFTVEVIGQVTRQDAPNAVAATSFAGAFAPPFDTFAAAQGEDLEWGDGREMRLTYRPDGPWSMSLGLRYARTNGTANPYLDKRTDPVCAFQPPLESLCVSFADDPQYGPVTRVTAVNWSESLVKERERYNFADLSVIREFDIPGLSSSSFGLALQYAHLESDSSIRFRGVPDWDLSAISVFPFPEGVPATHTEYSYLGAATREFEGAGPVLSWNASHPLIEAPELGSVRLQWSISGGALFGDQTTSVEAVEAGNLYETSAITLIQYNLAARTPVPVGVAPPLNVSRSQSETVPMLGAALGVSYSVSAFKTEFGYRWERYYNAIDGGISQREKEDRTIDGPYFKVSVGFGG